MRINEIDRRMSTYAGLLVILFYSVFTLISWILYPFPFTPWDNYLSRLGNFDYSPLGSYFYNIGCIATGIALIPFFIGLSYWYSGRIQKPLLFSGQLLGIASGFALMLIGVFSEDQGQPHMIASSIFFELNFLVLILVCIGLYLNEHFPKLPIFYGLVIDILTLIFAIIAGGPLVEWFTVFGSLLFVGMVSIVGIMQLKENG